MRKVTILVLTLVIAGMSAGRVLAASGHDVTDELYTQPTIELKPSLFSGSSYQEAKLWFLPDYQEHISDNDRYSGSVNDTDGGEDHINLCRDFGSQYMSSHPDSYRKDCKTAWLAGGQSGNISNKKLTCYYDCVCKSRFVKTSCPTWYVLAGDSCNDGGATKYERCDPAPCASGYTAGTTSCGLGYSYSSNGYSGSQVCGKCTSVPCAGGYSTSVTSCGTGYSLSKNGYSGGSACGACNVASCVSGSTSSSCPSGYTSSTNGYYSGSSPCYSCSANSCSGYDLTASKGSGWSCSSCLSGSTTKYKCTASGCAMGSTSSSCPAGQTATANGYYAGSSPCYSCSANSCSGYDLTSSKGSGWNCSSCQSGSTTKYSCSAKSCAVGSPSSSCPVGQTATANGYYAGDSACYSCNAASCSGYGELKIGSGWSCSDTCKSGSSTLYKCTCTPTCKDTVSVPANATAVKTSCTDCGGSKQVTTDFTCNSGYSKSGSSCVAACSLPTCTSITTKPANSSYTTASCTDCGGSKTINNGWTCNSGYSQSGNSCVAACVPLYNLSSCPANGNCTGPDCAGKYRLDRCDSGYQRTTDDDCILISSNSCDDCHLEYHYKMNGPVSMGYGPGCNTEEDECAARHCGGNHGGLCWNDNCRDDYQMCKYNADYEFDRCMENCG